MEKQPTRKTLNINYDGKIYVTGYGMLRLGDMDLSTIVSDALLMDKNEFRELNARVTIKLTLKDLLPEARWIDADGE